MGQSPAPDAIPAALSAAPPNPPRPTRQPPRGLPPAADHASEHTRALIAPACARLNVTSMRAWVGHSCQTSFSGDSRQGPIPRVLCEKGLFTSNEELRLPNPIHKLPHGHHRPPHRSTPNLLLIISRGHPHGIELAIDPFH